MNAPLLLAFALPLGVAEGSTGSTGSSEVTRSTAFALAITAGGLALVTGSSSARSAAVGLAGAFVVMSLAHGHEKATATRKA